MPQKTWVLTDVIGDQHVDQLSVGPEDVGGDARGYGVVKRTLRGGRRDGVEVVEINNGRMLAVVVPTRGMGIWRAICGDVVLGWRSPVDGPVHPAFVPLWEPSGIGWLSGFDEWLVRCGLESNGAPEFAPNGALRHPLHGKIANTPAHELRLSIDGDAGEIRLTGVVDESRLFGNKLRLTSTLAMTTGRSALTVIDEVENLSAEPSELELLYHMNFGLPPAEPDARVVLPVQTMAPRDAVAAENLAEWDRLGPETPGLGEACFFFDLAADAEGRTRAMLRSADSQRGVGVLFNKRELPCFTLWKNRQAVEDGYVVGLEPALNFPNVKSFEKSKGRVVTLSPGESRRFEITVEVHADAKAVADAERAVASLQGTVSPEVRRQPNPDWSAG